MSTATTTLSRKQKERVAEALLNAAGSLVEFWDDDQIAVEDARAQITTWLRRLPGEVWDYRLDDPDAPGSGRWRSAPAPIHYTPRTSS